MSSRLELELTSKRPDDTWTWRKAGAKEPKGTLQGILLFEGAKVGDVIRADVTVGIEGITVDVVLPPQKRDASRQNVIEIAPARAVQQLTNVEYAKKQRSGGKDRRETGERKGTDPRRRPERSPRPESSDKRTRPASETHKELPKGEASGERKAPRREPTKPRTFAAKVDPKPAAPRYSRLNPGHKHRSAYMAQVPEEHKPIAEQLANGGLPSVRNAIAEQNKDLAKEGKVPMPADPILTIAEGLLPGLERASWLDRAEAALSIADNIGLRDLKTVVSFGDRVAKSEDMLATLAKLRELLVSRTATLETEWVTGIEDALTEGKSIKAVRMSTRAPDLSSKLPIELTQRLSEAAGETLSPSASSDHFAAMLAALETSPVRKTVKPRGLPEHPTPELLSLAQQMSGRIPGLAELLGIKMPPPPRSRRKIGEPAEAPKPKSEDSAQPSPDPVSELQAETEPQQQATVESVSEPELVALVSSEPPEDNSPPILENNDLA